MRILVQAGNLGSSIINHRMRPLARADNVERVFLVCRNPGPEIPKLEYHCPPKFVARFASAAIVYEFLTLFYLSIFRKPGCISGYFLFPHGLIAFVVGKLTRRPIVVSLIAGPTDLLRLGSRLRVDSTNVSICGRLFLKMLKHCNAVTTTGSFTRDFLIRQGVEGDKIYPIINPPDDARVHPTAMPKRYDVISVGRLAPEKHIEILLKAASRVKRRYNDIKVGIVGDGGCKAGLVKLAEELGLNGNVDFVGYQKDVAYYYNSSNIFVLTSEHEGFPNVFLEAMMCGIPSVVSNCGDITDIAKDGVNCVVIQRYDDYEGFAAAIVHLLEDEDTHHKLSENALKTVTGLSIEQVTQKWETILKGLKATAQTNEASEL